MNPHRFNSLEEALESVPRELQPTCDLWPAIARSLHQTAGPSAALAPGVRRQQWPMALAASLSVLALVGALCWSVVQQRTQVELTAQRAAASGPGYTLVSLESPQDAAYVATRAALEGTFRARLALLAPATKSRIEADIRTALAQDPASPLLWQLLRSTWQQELDVYTNVARATDPI
jgi:hypothetical protein